MIVHASSVYATQISTKCRNAATPEEKWASSMEYKICAFDDIIKASLRKQISLVQRQLTRKRISQVQQVLILFLAGKASHCTLDIISFLKQLLHQLRRHIPVPENAGIVALSIKAGMKNITATLRYDKVTMMTKTALKHLTL